MNVKVSKLRELMTDALAKRGYSNEDIPFLIDGYLGGELRGHKSHGLAAFPNFASKDIDANKPEVIKESPATALIEANSANGAMVGKMAADKAVKAAKEHGSHTVFIKNMKSWLRPGGVAEYIAEQDMVAIVINSGGGKAVAPPGGYDPVIGTNPIAYAIPTQDEPLVVDMATSKRAWGEVRLANKYGTDLPADTYYDADGKVTLDPKKAESVKSFGDYKGFSLALLVELMCGSMLGMEMMVDSSGGSTFGGKLPDRGAVIRVIDPSFLGDVEDFKKANSELIADIENSNALEGEEIRIPGRSAGKMKAKLLKDDSIEIEEEVWEELQALV